MLATATEQRIHNFLAARSLWRASALNIPIALCSLIMPMLGAWRSIRRRLGYLQHFYSFIVLILNTILGI
ncbi:hypothetical protein MPC4_120004 [Methylocella tundrae]|uniref:Uncharacterized protein n=1 Tax=Methylocella tundrae TaxID=227605 RepID=A0A8B6M381_METTU|nr:hypothetical protein MPC1_8670002 [Methylocella tundrae]VTZ48879.1 hypothetical protein MPC4_120004 [Methylocella tundrae]